MIDSLPLTLMPCDFAVGFDWYSHLTEPFGALLSVGYSPLKVSSLAIGSPRAPYLPYSTGTPACWQLGWWSCPAQRCALPSFALWTLNPFTWTAAPLLFDPWCVFLRWTVSPPYFSLASSVPTDFVTLPAQCVAGAYQYWVVAVLWSLGIILGWLPWASYSNPSVPSAGSSARHCLSPSSYSTGTASRGRWRAPSSSLKSYPLRTQAAAFIAAGSHTSVWVHRWLLWVNSCDQWVSLPSASIRSERQ